MFEPSDVVTMVYEDLTNPVLLTSGSLDDDDMVRSMTSSKLLSVNFLISVTA